MIRPLQVLIVDDSESDARLIAREIQRSGASIVFERVEDAGTMRSALARESWDVVLSDWAMPRFSAPAALNVLRELRIEIPFIIVSGAIGEETAVDAMRAGASDYVLKDHLARLVPAIEREVGQERAHNEMKQRRGEDERFFSITRDLLCILRPDGHLHRLNPAWSLVLGWTEEELKTRVWGDLVHPADREASLKWTRELLGDRAKGIPFENRFLCKDGSYLQILWTAALHAPGQVIYAAGRDITDRKRAEDDAEAQRGRLRSLFLEAPAMINILRGPDLVVELAHPLSERFWGERLVEGQSLHAHPTASGGLKAARERLAEVYRTGERFVGRELPFVAQGDAGDKRPRFMDVVDQPMRNGSGEVEGVMTFVLEVTEQVEARRALEETGRQKDEFLAILSHELRTPLQPILGWANLLRANWDKLSPERQRKALATIERNAKTLSGLIEDVLDVSRIVLGKIRIEPRQSDLRQIVDSALDAVRASADLAQIDLQFVADDEPAMVWVDPARLQQVIWNLLTNAIKFTPSGGRVRIEVTRVADEMHLLVTDTGRGISAEFLPHVFERFRQGDSSSIRTRGGLGLGLSIVQHLVELQGGRVSAVSEGTERGSSFSVSLPTSAEAAEVARTARGPSSESQERSPDLASTLEGVRILLVDDEPDSREILRSILETSGAQVSACASGVEALGALAREVPEIIVSDIGMPVMDGYALIRQIRQLPDPRQSQVPAIALTAYARTEDRRQALSAGFQSHLAKPIQPTDLTQAVSLLVSNPTRGSGSHREAAGRDA